MSETKICTRCKIEKPLDEFYARNKRPCKRASACKECESTYAKEFGRTTFDRREWHLKKRYKLTMAQFQALLEAQNFKCKICERILEPGLRTNVDHDHNCCPGPFSCGNCIRGLLCSSCNQGIGYLQDSPKILQKAIDYLQAP